MDTVKKTRTFAERLKEEMVTSTKKLNQSEWGKEFGVKQSVVSDYTTGKKMPTIETARKMAISLGITVEWLYTERGAKYPELDIGNMPDKQKALNECWGMISEDDQMSLLNLANRFAGIFKTEPYSPDEAVETEKQKA